MNYSKIAVAPNQRLRRTWVRACVLAGFTLLAGLSLANFGKADAPSADAPDGEAEFESARYKEAIPLLRRTVTQDPGKPAPAAHLLNALVHEGQLGEAEALGAQLEQNFPGSADALAARGDLSFYRGDLGGAEKLWIAALKASPDNALAYFGLYRVYRAASMYFGARNRVMKAHDLDPANLEIARVWFALLTPEKRKELFEQYRRFNQPVNSDEELQQDFGQPSTRN